jgi:hypothetical protein
VTTIRPGHGAGIDMLVAIELQELRTKVAKIPMADMAPDATFVR